MNPAGWPRGAGAPPEVLAVQRRARKSARADVGPLLTTCFSPCSLPPRHLFAADLRMRF
jgi:hypothetical protein